MNIYFSGIGGVGIGPLAEIAYDAGYQVFGSDIEETLMVRELSAKGIKINIGQDGEYLKACHNDSPIDRFVYTSALPADHPELVMARNLGIHTSKRDELLADIIRAKNLKLIAIAGTHGKTTTTGMTIWAFNQLNIPVSYSVGTTLTFGPSGKFDPASEYFVYECDEFDRNFLNFSPFVAIITSVDYDHPDTYPTRDNYLAAFHDFASQSRNVITWDNQNPQIYDGLNNVILFRSDETNQNIHLAGEHNRRNATLVEKMFESIGVSQNIDDILSSFPGTNRRFEKLAENLYTDYGHHPVEIAATLQMARELSDHVTLVYQPHQNIRQHEVRNEYGEQFNLAEEIYWLPTYLAREDPNLEVLTPEQLTEKIPNKSSVHFAEMNQELWNNIQNARNRGNLVLIMGAGRVDGWVRNQLN